MVRDLLLRVLVGELSKYGRDDAGNVVISPGSLEEVANKVTETLGKSVERPVLTVTQPQIFQLAGRAGFKLIPTRIGGVQSQMLMDRTGSSDHLEVVSRLIDFTLQYAMNEVAERTKVPS